MRPKYFYVATSTCILLLRNFSDIKMQQLRHNSFWKQLHLSGVFFFFFFKWTETFKLCHDSLHILLWSINKLVFWLLGQHNWEYRSLSHSDGVKHKDNTKADPSTTVKSKIPNIYKYLWQACKKLNACLKLCSSSHYLRLNKNSC